MRSLSFEAQHKHHVYVEKRSMYPYNSLHLSVASYVPNAILLGKQD